MFNSSCPLNYAEILSVHSHHLKDSPSVFFWEVWVFADFPVTRFQAYFLTLRWCLQVGIQYRTQWTFFVVRILTQSRSSVLCTLCRVPLQVFVQMHNALNLKQKNNLAHHRAVVAWQKQRAARSCVGKGREGRQQLPSNSVAGVTVYRNCLKRPHSVCFGLLH